MHLKSCGRTIQLVLTTEAHGDQDNQQWKMSQMPLSITHSTDFIMVERYNLNSPGAWTGVLRVNNQFVMTFVYHDEYFVIETPHNSEN